MKKIILLFILFSLFSKGLHSQGYLGSKFYTTIELLHPITGNIDIQVAGGMPINRFYALELQLQFRSESSNILGAYPVKNGYPTQYFQEYIVGKARLNGVGARLTFRNFKKASLKAAPIGWYINYSLAFWRGSIIDSVLYKSDLHYDRSLSSFIESSNSVPLNTSFSTISFIFTPGKSFKISRSFFIDMGIDVGIRIYQITNDDWKFTSTLLYPENSFFKNNINSRYMYKRTKLGFYSGRAELIYEPQIKLGILF